MDDLIKQGADAFRAGNRDEARKLLLAAVKQNPESERAWGWLYNVTNNDQEQVQCLKQMVRINPKNEKANRLLNELQGYDFPLDNPPSRFAPEHRYSVETMKFLRAYLRKLILVILIFGGMVIFLAIFYPGAIELFLPISLLFSGFNWWPIIILWLLVFAFPYPKH